MENSMMSREKTIVKTSVIGIVSNVFLAIFKAIVGIISNSIAIILDAVNNLSDALSSVITIIGTKLAGKKPDKEHPYGHGRIEYITAMLISAIVLYAGATSFIESVKKIINPETPDYTMLSIIIVIVAVVVKIVLGLYVKKIGRKVNSDSLIASGQDALMDSIISTSTVVAALLFILFDISVEAWLGTVISIIIIKSGIDMLKSTLSQILGERIDSDFAKEIKYVINTYPEVHGAFDLILNNYGPDTYIGSIHIEVDDTMTATHIDELTRKIMYDVYEKTGVILSAIGIYSVNTTDKEVMAMREVINGIVHSYESILQMHGFYVNKEDKKINFDIIIDFDEENKDKIHDEILSKIQEKYQDYKISITMDFDVSD